MIKKIENLTTIIEDYAFSNKKHPSSICYTLLNNISDNIETNYESNESINHLIDNVYADFEIELNLNSFTTEKKQSNGDFAMFDEELEEDWETNYQRQSYYQL